MNLENKNSILTNNEREEISDEELLALTNAIKMRYGIDFTNYEKKSLKRGFARIISKNNLGSLVGLWSKILKDREFFLGCIDDLLVNLTELFRNPEIWIKIKDDLLKKIESKPQIKIWHAGCSTGEEIYTMAIVLKENNLLFKTKAFASDLSSIALAKAMEGKYPQILWKKYVSSYLKYNEKGNLENYFSIDSDYARVKEEYKKHVMFQRHNLVQDPVNQKFSVIFCRNVMIYFDEQLKMKVIKLFYDSLEDNGFFIIGYYDMLPDASKEYFTLYDATTRVYIKNKK